MFDMLAYRRPQEALFPETVWLGAPTADTAKEGLLARKNI